MLYKNPVFTELVNCQLGHTEEGEKMTQAQVEEWKRSLIEQALDASNIKVETKKRKAKEKQESEVEKKKAKAKPRPQKPKIKVEKVKRTPKLTITSVLPKVSVVDTMEPMTDGTTALNHSVAEEKDFDEAYERVECPDGIPGCEVWHGELREDKGRAIQPNEIQSYDVIIQRGKASAIQCYVSLVVDVVCIALVQYCKETCEGCKTDCRKEHTLCILPVNVVWPRNRLAILARVNLASMMGRWASAIYASCGISHSEVEKLFGLPNPVEMIGMLMVGKARDDDDKAQLWRMGLNKRMAEIKHPVNYCSFDEALKPALQYLKSQNN